MLPGLEPQARDLPVHPAASGMRPTTVRRKGLLYRSRLGFHCVNHVQGCAHGCLYPCHAFLLARRYGRVTSYEEWCAPKLVENALDLLADELARKSTAQIPAIHLCLTTDPFMAGHPEVVKLSLQVIELINAHRIPCSVLTKGVLPLALADRRRFSRDNTLGISLISLDEGLRARWEPHTAPYRRRIDALRALHDAGCRTRVHMEPYPTPDVIEQELVPILEAVSFVDDLFFGRWNYNAAVSSFAARDAFYRAQAVIMRRFARQRRIQCDVAVG